MRWAARGGCTEEDVSKIALTWEGELWHGHTSIALTCGGGCWAHATSSRGAGDAAVLWLHRGGRDRVEVGGKGALEKRPGVQLEHAQGDGWLR